jgi:hypothetical protein
MSIKSRFSKLWISRELTDKIRDKFKKTYGFTEIIEKVVISDLEEENNKESNGSEVSLNKELRGMDHEIERSEVKKLEKLNIEKEIILTEEFINKKMLEELEEWFIKNVVDCGKCNERRVRKYMHETEEKLMLCKECKEKESKENDNESDDMSIDIEIDNREIVIHKFEIERLKKLGFNKYHFTLEFIRKYYKENEGKPDEDLKKILNEIEKPIEQKEEVTDEEDDSEEKDNRKQEEKVDRLLKIAKEQDIEVSERELLRLVSYEFNEEEIFNEGFIRKFQEIKNELESYIVEELGKFFDKQKKRIENDEEIESISNISENEEIEIVTDDKDEDENKLEKPINTDDFGFSEESDSEKLKPKDINNSDSESNSSEEINNMAAQ